GLHPYPARMVPDIARKLISTYSEPGDVVYDPFCGSGTTLVEAGLQDRHGIGVDLNPFAVLLTRVKTSPMDPELLLAEWNCLESRLARSSAASRRRVASQTEGQFLDLKYWYKPYVLRDLGFLRAFLTDFYPPGEDPVGDF